MEVSSTRCLLFFFFRVLLFRRRDLFWNHCPDHLHIYGRMLEVVSPLSCWESFLNYGRWATRMDEFGQLEEFRLFNCLITLGRYSLLYFLLANDDPHLNKVTLPCKPTNQITDNCIITKTWISWRHHHRTTRELTPLKNPVIGWQLGVKCRPNLRRDLDLDLVLIRDRRHDRRHDLGLIQGLDLDHHPDLVLIRDRHLQRGNQW